MRTLDVTPEPISGSLRCVDLSRAMGNDPVGSAGAYDVFVLVETPLPWPREVTDDPVLGDVAAAAAEAAPGRRVRVQAIASADVPTDHRRVIVWQANADAFDHYTRLEATAAPAELVAVAAGLVAGTPPTTRDDVVDLLVCTHGGRDRCCGSEGTRLWRAIVPADGVRVWRTSHTGGHRFAPTAISFPDGLSWGRLTPELVAAVHARSTHPAELADHYRGCFAFASSMLQAAERAAFAAVGWEWLTWTRWGERVTDTVARVSFRTPDGDEGAFVAVIVEHRRLPVPVCGDELSAARKTEPEWRVVAFERQR